MEQSITMQTGSLQTEMEQRRTQIAGPEDPGDCTKQLTESITNIPEVKCAFKNLIGKLVSSKVEDGELKHLLLGSSS
ncbi:Hypothetical predicted protein [Podarcis lilfordi]|uniref:Uncharacterized protein n=1 Tax=Podarcis lilfordi TaxID=74358 RepID=A0AA35KKP5_9SAUR|nr:Hypothetical predicted protein [Podarcis lilfordi]